MEQISETLYENIDITKVITVFSSQELEEIFGKEWHKNLFDPNSEDSNEEIKIFLTKIVEKKNDKLLEKLIHRLLHLGKDLTAVQIDPSCIDLVDLKRCDPRNGHVDKFSFGELNPKDEIIIDNAHASKRGSMSNVYDMRGNPRGYCYLLNNYFTKGTYKEMQRFRKIFHQLKFDVIMRKNLDAKEIIKDLFMISKSGKLKSHNAFMFMSISHGNSNGEIIGFDGQTVKIEKLVDLFNNDVCPDMKRKPRIFFFNCCRGTNRDAGVSASLAKPYFDIDTQTPKMAKASDLFICYSTLEGLLAQVNADSGTLFGKALADSFVEKVNYKDITAIITEANRKLQNETHKNPLGRQPIEGRNIGATRQLFFC